MATTNGQPTSGCYNDDQPADARGYTEYDEHADARGHTDDDEYVGDDGYNYGAPNGDGSDDDDRQPAIGEGHHDDARGAGTTQTTPCSAPGGSPTAGTPGSPGDELGPGECCGDPNPQQLIDPDRRTHPQRLYDALSHVLERILSSGQLPRRGGTPTTVLVTIPLATLKARTGYASTAHGGDIATREVVRRAGDTTFVPIVID